MLVLFFSLPYLQKTKTPRPPPLMGQHAPLSLMHSMDSHTMSVALESEGKGRGSGAHKGALNSLPFYLLFCWYVLLLHVVSAMTCG